MSPLRNSNPARCYAGTTLLEMLITLLILMVGIFAIGQMLSQSISLLSHALNQQRAALAINSMAETLQGIPEDILRAPVTTADHACTDGHPCSPEQFFADSLHHWTLALARKLPGGQGEMQLAAADEQDMLRLSVTWRSGNNQTSRRESVVPISPVSGYIGGYTRGAP